MAVVPLVMMALARRLPDGDSPVGETGH